MSGAKAKALQRKATIDWDEALGEVGDYLYTAGDNWRSVFVPLMQGVMTAQGERWAAELGLAFDVRNFYAEEWFETYTLQFAQPILDTTEHELAAMFRQAQAEGWSIPTMQRHLTDVFQQYMSGDLTPEDFSWFEQRMSPYRTEMIARTETIRASNAGTTQLFGEWGVGRKEWLSTKDDRTRAYERGDEFDHLEADGQVVGMDEPFIVSGEELQYPGDPNGSPGNTINCRCTVLPVL